jgi:hypothetical protein
VCLTKTEALHRSQLFRRIGAACRSLTAGQKGTLLKRFIFAEAIYPACLIFDSGFGPEQNLSMFLTTQNPL